MINKTLLEMQVGQAEKERPRSLVPATPWRQQVHVLLQTKVLAGSEKILRENGFICCWPAWSIVKETTIIEQKTT